MAELLLTHKAGVAAVDKVTRQEGGSNLFHIMGSVVM